MCKRYVIKSTLIGSIALAGLFLPACQSTERPQSFTGTVEPAKPKYVPHGKGQQWGRIVYER